MNIFQDYMIHEFVEDYRHGHLSRRDLLRRVLFITGGIASAATVLSGFGLGQAAPAFAQTPPVTSPLSVPDNPSIDGADITFPGPRRRDADGVSGTASERQWAPAAAPRGRAEPRRQRAHPRCDPPLGQRRVRCRCRRPA